MDKAKLALLVAGVALVVGGLGLVLPGQPTVQVVKEVVERLGAFSGPDITSDFLSVNGVSYEYRSQKFITGTTTVCQIEVPRYNVSSTTLVDLSVSVHGVPTTTTGNVWRVYKGAELGATTTGTLLLSREAITATGTAFYATSTDGRFLFGASSTDRYLMVELFKGDNPYLGNSGATGQCNAKWMVH